jgi:hypothetical protein
MARHQRQARSRRRRPQRKAGRESRGEPERWRAGSQALRITAMGRVGRPAGDAARTRRHARRPRRRAAPASARRAPLRQVGRCWRSARRGRSRGARPWPSGDARRPAGPSPTRHRTAGAAGALRAPGSAVAGRTASRSEGSVQVPAPSLSRRFGATEPGRRMSPGTASTGRPRSSAAVAVNSDPERPPPSTTTTASASPATMRLRARTIPAFGGTHGSCSDTRPPPAETIRSKRPPDARAAAGTPRRAHSRGPRWSHPRRPAPRGGRPHRCRAHPRRPRAPPRPRRLPPATRRSPSRRRWRSVTRRSPRSGPRLVARRRSPAGLDRRWPASPRPGGSGRTDLRSRSDGNRGPPPRQQTDRRRHVVAVDPAAELGVEPLGRGAANPPCAASMRRTPSRVRRGRTAQASRHATTSASVPGATSGWTARTSGVSRSPLTPVTCTGGSR